MTCSESLLELKKFILEQIDDETKSAANYKAAAEKALTEFGTSRRGSPNSGLMKISGDESEHKRILESILEVITEKCESPVIAALEYQPGDENLRILDSGVQQSPRAEEIAAAEKKLYSGISKDKPQKSSMVWKG